MNIVEITEWLKTTIPGIILLGAIGSIFGVIIIWFSIKLFKIVISAVKTFIDKVLGENFFKLFVGYMKLYYQARGLILQLKEKDDQIPLVVLHQQALANRNLISLMGFVLFLLTVLLFVFTGTDYPKTAIFLVSLSIIFIHDAIFVSYWTKQICRHFYGYQLDLSKNTYANKNTVIQEISISSKNRLNAHKNIET